MILRVSNAVGVARTRSLSKKLRWLQFRKVLKVYSDKNLGGCDDPGDCHSGDPVSERSKLTYFMGLRDLQSTTWCLNKTRMRTWYHLPVVTIDGRELWVKMEKKGWAGWTPKSEDERLKSQEIVLFPKVSREWVDDGQEGGLTVLQERLEEAAAVVLEDVRMMPTVAAKMQASYSEERTHEKGTPGQRRIRCQSGCPSQRDDCAETSCENSGLQDVPAKTEKNGWRRWEPTAQDTTKTPTRPLWCTRRGFENNDAAVTPWLRLARKQFKS